MTRETSGTHLHPRAVPCRAMDRHWAYQVHILHSNRIVVVTRVPVGLVQVFDGQGTCPRVDDEDADRHPRSAAVDDARADPHHVSVDEALVGPRTRAVLEVLVLLGVAEYGALIRGVSFVLLCAQWERAQQRAWRGRSIKHNGEVGGRRPPSPPPPPPTPPPFPWRWDICCALGPQLILGCTVRTARAVNVEHAGAKSAVNTGAATFKFW